MADFRLEIAPRQIDRLFEKAIGNSIVKALTEPITNSDDSYRRLEQGLSTSSSVKKRSPITIKVFRNTRIFQIIDQAEGLTNKEMEEKFVAYGADMSGQSVGLPVRGLFGKGLKDVMFTQQKSNVKTIKDGKSYKCKFHRKGDDHVVSIIPGPKVTSDLRRSWGIGNGNGTVVEFQLRDGVPLPLHDKLVEKLCKFYMLHTIASANKRVLEVQTYSNNGQLQKKSIVKYEEPTGIVLLDHSFNLTFENYSDIKVEVTIKRHENELEQTNFEEREGGLLVIDDRNTVYDLALFGFDRDPYATRLFGTVRLTGARQIILDKLRQNEEILSDTRDGFDRKHSFYSTLAKKIDALLEPLVKKEREIKQANQKSDVSADQKKRHIEACEKLNQLYESLTGGKSEFIGTDPESNTDPPKDGIEFVRPKITITANKYYAIVLRIDTNRIRPGSTIVINSTNNYITASPAMLVVDDPKTDDSVINKTITIQSTGSGEQGVIQATYNARNAQVVVTVISEQVFIPSDGLNFHPDVYRIRQGQLSHISLYADLSKVDKSNESISITSSSTVIQLDAKVMKLSEGKMINDKIIKFEIPIIGYKIGGAARITAVCGEFKALANITIVKKKDPTDTSPKGIFSDIKFGKLAVKHQTTYDPMTGIIIINTEHPINKMYFGEDPDLVVRTLPHCQVLQAELVLSECLNYMVQKAISENKLPRRTTHEPTDIQHYILESKLNIGNEIHKILVDHQLLKEMTKNYGTDQLASTHTETNTKTAISGKRRSDSNDMLSMPPGYLRQVILQVLSTRPNQSCKKDALTGLVLAHLNIRTRGKPRQDFDHRVNRMLSSMKRQSIVEIYKSRNVRVRINRQSGTQQMLAL